MFRRSIFLSALCVSACGAAHASSVGWPRLAGDEASAELGRAFSDASDDAAGAIDAFPFDERGPFAARITCIDMAMVRPVPGTGRRGAQMPNGVSPDKIANRLRWFGRYDMLCREGRSEAEVRAALRRERDALLDQLGLRSAEAGSSEWRAPEAPQSDK